MKPFLFALFVLVLSVSALNQAPRGTMVLTGARSGVDTERIGRAYNQKGWEDAWRAFSPQKMHARMHRPQIDFATKMVVVCFMGEVENTVGLILREMKLTETEMILNVERLDYVSLGKSDRTTPYAFFIVPRTRKSVIINVDGRSLGQRAGNAPAKWESYKSLDALPAGD
jgi:hypothetical protein